jgi:hypothetical protein
MSRFLDLMHQTPPIPEKGPGCFDFSNPDRLFPAAVGESPFRLWKPGDPIARQGTRILIGVATWSGYDMQLLDMLEEALSRATDVPLVEVFNAGILTSMDEFYKYILEVPDVFHTPAVGVWRDGVLTERAAGYAARDLVARMFGFSSDAVVAAVDQAQAARAS